MSRDDLLADLQDEVAARPVAPHVPPPGPPTGGRGALTPTFGLQVTPLRWRLPSVRPADDGVGLAVAVGPLQVSVGVR